MPALELRLPTPLECVDIGKEWPRWTKSFLVYLRASGKHTHSEPDKIATFLWSIGPRGMEIYESLFTNEDDSVDSIFADAQENAKDDDASNENQDRSTRTLKEVIKAFDEYCLPRKNITMEVFKFDMIKQKERQSFAEYETELRTQLKYCDFECEKCKSSYADRMLMHRIVIGVSDKKLQMKLLDSKEDTVSKVIDTCKVFEAAAANKQLLDQQSSLMEVKGIEAAVDEGRKESTVAAIKRTNCYNCGQIFNGNHRRVCPARSVACHTCSKIGHFSKFCKKSTAKEKLERQQVNKYEMPNKAIHSVNWEDEAEYLVDQLSTKNESAQNIVLEKITNYCGKPVTNYTTDQFEEPYTWTFYHAFFFSFTVLSTVGYGNLAPTTTLGRMIMVVYSLIGIPINGILFSGLGDYFSKTFTSIYRRYKKYKMSNDIRYVPPQLGLLATVCIALVPGITFFIILPSLIFSYFESWSFATSVYYSYVTMTTIGFGDFVPTFQPFQPREFGGLFVVYQVFIIVWFIFSLGYLVMIMTFISKGLQSKKLSRLEYQLSENIKATQNRIWNGVTKDVGYLRRILNELYIMKFKPVYNESFYFAQKRSISCPDLTMYRVDPPVISRKRAFSECYGTVENRVGNTPPFRTSSDTELSNINKQRTFETAESFKQTTDLLAQVVSALASIRPHEEELTLGSSGINGGYHGFTDSQILSSEWSFPPPGMNSIPQRERAFSDFNLHPRTTMRPGTNEWTWSGDNNQIQQAINIRCRNRHKSVFPGTMEHPGVVVDIDRDEETVNRQKRKFSMPDGGKQFFKKLIPFRKRSSQGLIDKNGVGDRKFSITSVPEVPPRINSRPDYYSTINIGQLDVKKTAPDLNNIHNMFANGGYGVPSILNRRNTLFDVAPRKESYQKSLPPQFAPPTGFSRKRRESLFTQNPNMRRSSMFPGGVAPNRRGSLFTDLNPRNTNLDFVNRRPSLFSVADEEVANQEILENTTIADLIRALEVMHTQAVLQQPVDESSNDKKRRKLGTAGLAPPVLSPIFSIFNPDDQPSTSGNRLYSRRSTIVGPTLNQPTTTSILNRRRLSTVPVDLNDPPPSYTEKETPKFKRRFSVRPTNLQIPPGMAPPPPPMPSGLTGITSGANSNQIATQTALQRRLSLRPSPLARDANDGAASATRGGMSSLPKLGSSGVSRMAVPPSSSSTHSPLSRIVQISQAQRKNSEQKDKDSK